jgi:hypothetical protein
LDARYQTADECQRLCKECDERRRIEKAQDMKLHEVQYSALERADTQISGSVDKVWEHIDKMHVRMEAGFRDIHKKVDNLFWKQVMAYFAGMTVLGTLIKLFVK